MSFLTPENTFKSPSLMPIAENMPSMIVSISMTINLVESTWKNELRFRFIDHIDEDFKCFCFHSQKALLILKSFTFYKDKNVTKHNVAEQDRKEHNTTRSLI